MQHKTEDIFLFQLSTNSLVVYNKMKLYKNTISIHISISFTP